MRLNKIRTKETWKTGILWADWPRLEGNILKWVWKGAQERWVKISRGFFNCALIYCVTRLALPRECLFGQATDELLVLLFILWVSGWPFNECALWWGRWIVAEIKRISWRSFGFWGNWSLLFLVKFLQRSQLFMVKIDIWVLTK